MAAKSAKTHDIVDRQRIHLKAKRKLGLLNKDAEQDFMDQCVQNLMDSGEFDDEADAEAVCTMLYDEGDTSDTGNA